MHGLLRRSVRLLASVASAWVSSGYCDTECLPAKEEATAQTFVDAGSSSRFGDYVSLVASRDLEVL